MINLRLHEWLAGQLVLPGLEVTVQKQIEYKPIYLASELSDEAKEVVAEKYRQWNVNYDGWWDGVEEGFKEDMKEYSLEVDKIYFSGFWSQGDGACFECSVDDRQVFFNKMIKDKLPDSVQMRLMYNPQLEDLFTNNLSFGTRHSGHYYHSGCMDFTFEMDTYYHPEDWGDETGEEYDMLTQEEFNDIEDAICSFFREKADDLYSTLSREYDALCETECICESLDANDYLFYADGSEEA